MTDRSAYSARLSADGCLEIAHDLAHLVLRASPVDLGFVPFPTTQRKKSASGISCQETVPINTASLAHRLSAGLEDCIEVLRVQPVLAVSEHEACAGRLHRIDLTPGTGLSLGSMVRCRTTCAALGSQSGSEIQVGGCG